MANVFDRTLYAERNGRALHRTMDETLEENAIYAVHAISWEGDYADCKAMYDQHYCNEDCSADSFIGNASGRYGIVKVMVAKSLRHKIAGRGIVTFTVKAYNKGYEGNVDFERVERDIHCWRALCSKDVPKLDIVKLWERNLDIDRQDLWAEFKYVDSSGAVQEITDKSTKALCGMIYRGVESYPEYYPVLNITINFARHPAALGLRIKNGALLGKVVHASEMIPDGYQIPIGEISASPSPANDFEMLSGDFILCTADKLQCNGDGSYTLNRSFMKCRQIEQELYIGAPNAEYTPYDNKGK